MVENIDVRRNERLLWKGGLSCFCPKARGKIWCVRSSPCPRKNERAAFLTVGMYQLNGNMAYKYDLGISLRDTDKAIAEKLVSKLRDKYNIFFYPENQKNIAFRDGVELLPNVYRYESRAVLIFLRSDWGKTKWTKVEEEAIRARVFDEGTGFVLGVRMEKMQAPAWLPNTYFYHDFEKFDEDILFGAVVGKLSELEVEIRELSAIELAKKQADENNWRQIRQQRLFSIEAENAYAEAATELDRLLEEQIREINPNFGNYPIQIERQRELINLVRYPCGVLVYRHIDDNHEFPHQLLIREVDGVVSLFGNWQSPVPIRNKQMIEYGIDVDKESNWFWTNIKTREAASTAGIVNDMLKKLIDRSGRYFSGEIKFLENSSEESDNSFNNFTG